MDAFKDIKRIPDCSTSQAIRRLCAITKDLNEKQIESLLKYALAYPPRVRALAGAVLEQNGINTKGIQKLKDSLNPFTTFEFGLKEKDLPNKSNWHIA